ncbi:DHA2 family efflux MFS transporter permease subunit [Actinoalloteichus spitiensis]|uniref:DHA2 family efflux MFS transporter permease subunit n=1 Tax=Actinoalloteichus spitiensis TaxID=252394 RepID=UPI0003703B2E|nr:DHA2 family efflux MFS transporter permease subunit [Actinoalloteichus spitiensis]
MGRIAAVLVPGGLLALLSTTIVGVTVPGIVADLGADLASAQWVTSTYLLAAGVGIAASAWASARFGVRATWLVALTVFGVGAGLSALAPNLDVLITARALQGLGGGMLEPVMLTALAQAAGPARMGRVMGSVAAVMSVGPMAGPLLGGTLTDALDWRWVFGVPAIATVAVLAGSALVLPREQGDSVRLDGIGLGLLALTSVLALYGLSRAATPAGFDGTTLALLAAAVLALLVFVRWARPRGAAAIIDLSTFASRGFVPPVIIMLLLGVAIYPMFFGLPLYYQGVVGMSAASAGLLMVPYGLGNLVMMPLAGVLSDRLGARGIMWVGTGVSAAAFVLLLRTSPDTSTVTFAGIALAAGVGLGGVASPAVASIYRVLPAALIASGSTILFCVNQIGGALGVAVLTLLVGGPHWTADSGTAPLWVPLAAIVLVMVAVFGLPPANRPRSSEQPARRSADAGPSGG